MQTRSKGKSTNIKELKSINEKKIKIIQQNVPIDPFCQLLYDLVVMIRVINQGYLKRDRTEQTVFWEEPDIQKTIFCLELFIKSSKLQKNINLN